MKKAKIQIDFQGFYIWGKNYNKFYFNMSTGLHSPLQLRENYILNYKLYLSAPRSEDPVFNRKGFSVWTRITPHLLMYCNVTVCSYFSV